MKYSNELIASKLRNWEKYLKNYKLPQWEEIPDIGLYMEQILVLLKDYLDYLPPELKEEQFITASTINNYVQKKYMPEPIKKKYYRIHIAYMIMICTLKHSFSIAMLQKIIPLGLSEEEVKDIYSTYALRHKLTANYFIEQVRAVAGPILNHEMKKPEIAVDDTGDLIIVSAVISALSRLLAEKLLLLEGKTMEDINKMKKHIDN